MESLFSNIDKPLFYICGFRVLLPDEQDEKHPYILLQKNTDYIVKMGNSPWGNIKRIVNFLKSFDKEINKINRQIEEYETRIIQIKNQLSSPNQYAEKLAECKRERDKIMQLIKIQSSESEPVWKN
jgi:cell shape-determining protein MreC